MRAVAEICRLSSLVSEVVAVVPRKHGVVELQLSCGHAVRRRLSLCPPKRLVCRACQAGSFPRLDSKSRRTD